MTRLLALASLVCIGFSGRAHAQTYIWPGDAASGGGGNGVSGNWGDPRWRLSNNISVNVAPPSAADSVSALNGSSVFTIDVSDARAITNLSFNNSNATLRITATGQLAVGGNLTQTNGAANIVSGGVVTVAGFYTQGGAATIDGSLTVNGAYTQAGNLSGSGSLTLNGAYNWNGGTINGNVVAPNGGGLFGGSGNLNIATGSLTFGGVVNWDGGNVTMANGTTFTLSSGAVMTHTTDRNSTIQVGSGVTTGAFVNNGTVVHDTGSNQSIKFEPNLLFTNTGTVRALSGVNQTGLVLVRSTTTTTGVFDTGNATDGVGIINLDSGGTTAFNNGASVIGTGEFRVQGTHVVTLNAAIPTSNLTLGGGTIQGTGSMTLSGPLTWNGDSDLAGSATLTSPVGSTFTNHVRLSGSSILNLNAPVAGAATHSWNSGDFFLNGTSVVNVGVGATLVNVANQDVTAQSGTPTFNIAGTFRKQTGTSEAIFGGGGVPLAVNNSGAITVESGTLRFLNATLNNTGTLSSTSPGVISFTDNSVLNLNAGSVGQGTGLIRVASSSATVNVNATTTVTAFELSNGTFQGTQTLTAAGALTVAGGTLTQTAILKGTNGGSVGNATVNTGTLQLAAGTFSWTQTLNYTAAGLIQIDAGATLDMTGDRGLTRTAGAFTPAFNVNGTLVKTGGTSNGVIEANIAVTVGATGLVDVQSGTLQLRSNTTNNGTVRANVGGRLQFDTLITLSGSGLVDVAGGTLFTTHSGTITVPAGMSFTNTGTVQVQSGTLNIASTNLTNYSGGTLSGGTWQVSNGTLSLGARPVSTIAPGTVVDMSGGTFTGINSLTTNNGQFRVASGATVGTGTIVNSGVIEASGTLNGAITTGVFGVLTGRGTVAGNIIMNAGGTLSPGPGPFAVPGTSQLSLGTTALNGGSTYQWEVNSWTATPSAGTHFDQIRGGVSGAKLNLAGASSGDPVVLQIVSLNGTTPGPIPTFDGSVSRSWVIADYSNGNPGGGGILNFSADKFTIDTGGFENEVNSTGFSLSLSANSNQIILTYNPVPEPATVLLVAAAGGLCVRRLRRSVTHHERPADSRS